MDIKHKINQKQLKELHDMSEEIFGNICVLKIFCQEYCETDDMYKILPLVNYTQRTADKLYANLIELLYEHS